MLNDKEVFLKRVAFSELLEEPTVKKMARALRILQNDQCGILSTFQYEDLVRDLIEQDFEVYCAETIEMLAQGSADEWRSLSLEDQLQIILPSEQDRSCRSSCDCGI